MLYTQSNLLREASTLSSVLHLLALTYGSLLLVANTKHTEAYKQTNINNYAQYTNHNKKGSKEMARCSGHGNARNAENETTVRKKRLPEFHIL